MNSFKQIAAIAAALIAFVITASAQDFGPPKPLESKIYDAMVGSWTGEADMMGMPMSEVVNIRWALNHQYIIMEMTATAKNNPKMVYNGMGIFGGDEKGIVKSWWFDDWGAMAMTSGSGTMSDTKVDMTDGNDMYKESRSFEMVNGQIKMYAKGTMTMNGKDMPFEETIMFSKKK